MNTPSTQELTDFIESHELVILPQDSPIGTIHSLVSGSINYACPYDTMMLENALWWANGGL
jgi:hypothetical protein